MKVLILDDEPPARRGLKSALERIGITEIRETATIEQAIAALIEEKPDVLLLDVELRGGRKGFELLDTMQADGIPAIFVTAHPEHALKAFELRAVDYVVKPIDPSRLKESLGRISKKNPEFETHPFSRNDKVLFRDGGKNLLVRVGDIQVLEAADAYTKLYLTDGNGPMVTGTMKSLLDRLDPTLFFLAHRKQAINLDHISSIESGGVGFVVTMANGFKVELSRRHTTDLKRLIEV